MQVLEIGVYTILSISLELSLLRDSAVELKYPAEPVAVEPSPALKHPTPNSSRGRGIARAAKARDGIWSYLTKHSGNILGRARTISQGSNSQVSSTLGSEIERPKSPTLPVFSATINGIKECEGVLSTTPGVRFPPPVLLMELAEKEAKTGHSDLTAAQHVGLRSLLGWNVDHHLSGPTAFLRHQCLTMLYSQYVPDEEKKKEEEEDNTGHSTTSWQPCIQRYWRTYRYYSTEQDQDSRLGELVMDKCGNAEKPCTHKDCKFQVHSHQFRWVTGRTRIIARIHPDTLPPSDGISMWISCHECGASTPRRPMSNGSWLVVHFQAKYILTTSLGYYPLESISNYSHTLPILQIFILLSANIPRRIPRKTS